MKIVDSSVEQETSTSQPCDSSGNKDDRGPHRSAASINEENPTHYSYFTTPPLQDCLHSVAYKLARYHIPSHLGAVAYMEQLIEMVSPD